jgi:hypothetical protein
MAAATVTTNLTISWTPPGAALNSGNSIYQLQATYNGQNVGQVDITTAYVPAALVSIPFGNVTAAKVLFVKNMMSQEVSVRLNGAIADTFNLPPGGEFLYAIPAAPLAVPMTSATISAAAAPAVTESVQFFLLGD